MHAVVGNNAGVVEMLLERGADGTKTTTQAARGMVAGSTALDIARICANSKPGYAETLAVIRLRCCRTCGITSSSMKAAGAGGERRLKHCALCPAGGPRAQYCGTECQRADWARHREEHRRVG